VIFYTNSFWCFPSATPAKILLQEISIPIGYIMAHSPGEPEMA
jgi:hypothetical protein